MQKMSTSVRPRFFKLSDRCRFCGESVNLAEEGNTYPDGSCAHEGCADGAEFEAANAADFRD